MKRALKYVLIAAVLLVVVGAIGVWGTLRASLPTLTGEAGLAGLSAPVTVERDAAGVPTITASNRVDAARALGYVHAQERWFQMDLLRRVPAGELSELLGEATWTTDSTMRAHRFRARAEAVVASLPVGQRAVVDAYAEGANRGREALGARPFEYLALRQEPEPWQPEDSILAAYAMTINLQFDGGYGLELERAALEATLPPALADFLMPAGDEWDAPIEGQPLTPAPVPTAEQLDGFRPGLGALAEEEPIPGSNNWAVAGNLSGTGSAIVANDTHLGLRLPHIWFRASLVYGDGGAERRVTGATLPGAPLVILGSNGDVAWGLTNSYGDYIDYVRLIPGSRPGTVRTATGEVAVDTLRESVRVGTEVRTLTIVETPWGPVTARGADGADYAMQWSAHRPGSVDLGLLAVETATDLDQAFAAATRSGIPAQNFVAGDRAGRIGWTTAGRIPNRVGRDGRRPVDSTDPDALWDGWVAPDDVPRVLDPKDGRLWTANARVVSGEKLAVMGDGNYAPGARARQIRDGLRALDAPVSERDLLAIQLDDRALFYARWRDLLLSTLEEAPETPARTQMRQLVEDGARRAAPDDVGYRLVREWRSAVVDRTLPPLTAGVFSPDGGPVGIPARDEAPVWRLVTEQPVALLPPGHGSWTGLLLDAAGEVAADYDDLASATWGERNTLSMTHPMADAIPGLGARLQMPPHEQFGDERVPRVSGQSFGASQRMVVSPGHEESGIFHMPGGQTGHFLSPYWGAGHEDWAEGRPSAFLPGPTEWTLTLVPGS